MSTLKKDYLMPIAVLAAICLFISAALAVTNGVTRPVIEASAQMRAEAARMEVLPQADSFEPLAPSGLPEAVTEAYRAKNGAGFVFMLTAAGYGGDMKLICGMDEQGRITACRTLAHSETAGLGSKTAEDEFRSQFAGKDENLEGVSTISGATVSTQAYIDAIHAAFAAMESVKGAKP